MESTPNTMLPKIEAILRKGAWKVNNEDEFCLMAQAIIDKSPQNPKELHNAVGKYLTDGAFKFTKNMKKTCATVQKDLSSNGCIGKKIEVEKSESEEEETPSTSEATPGHIQEPEEQKQREARYGQDGNDEDRNAWLDKKEQQFAQRKYDEQAAVELQIDAMIATKEKVPPPEVMHDKSELYQADIFLPGVTIIAGNKLLIEDATVKLTKGRKYGLIGRNGTGKTTLINAICRKELDKMP